MENLTKVKEEVDNDVQIELESYSCYPGLKEECNEIKSEEEEKYDVEEEEVEVKPPLAIFLQTYEESNYDDGEDKEREEKQNVQDSQVTNNVSSAYSQEEEILSTDNSNYMENAKMNIQNQNVDQNVWYKKIASVMPKSANALRSKAYRERKKREACVYDHTAAQRSHRYRQRRRLAAQQNQQEYSNVIFPDATSVSTFSESTTAATSTLSESTAQVYNSQFQKYQELLEQTSPDYHAKAATSIMQKSANALRCKAYRERIKQEASIYDCTSIMLKSANALRCKAYRERKKRETGVYDHTAAQRSQRYRQRKLLEAQQHQERYSNVIFPDSTSSMSTFSESTTAVTSILSESTAEVYTSRFQKYRELLKRTCPDYHAKAAERARNYRARKREARFQMLSQH